MRFSKARSLRHSFLGIFLFAFAVRAGDLNRVKHPVTLSATAGYPAPSFVGGTFAFQSHQALQWVLGTGFFWSTDFNIQSLSGALRVHLLESDFTPIIGAGVSAFFFHGRGDIQGLEATSILGSLMLGLDWATPSRWRLGGGLQFHYPVHLTFPYLEAGLTF